MKNSEEEQSTSSYFDNSDNDYILQRMNSKIIKYDKEDYFNNSSSLESKNPEIIEKTEDYHFGRFEEILGSGTYKKVYRGYDYNEGRVIAWCEINIDNLSENSNLNQTIEEMNLMSKLNHPNIVKFITGWYNRKLKKVIMITEFISGGSLKLNIKQLNISPRLRLIKKWIKEILNGLSYLHNQNIIHRDIKCDNIFIDRITGNIKIGDLGNGIIVKKKFCTKFTGTEEFMAPEIHEGKYSFKVDIYSLGLTIIEMLTLETPYKECEGTLKIYENKKNEIYPESFYKINNDNVKNFIKLCLRKEKDRPTAIELLNNKWLNDDVSNENNYPVKIKNSLRLDIFQYKPKNNFIPLMINKKENEIQKKKIDLSKSSFTPVQMHSNILKVDFKKCENQRGRSYDKEVINNHFLKRNSSRYTDESTVDSQKKSSIINEGVKINKKNSYFKITIKDDKEIKKVNKNEIEIQFVVGKEEWKNKSKIYFLIFRNVNLSL